MFSRTVLHRELSTVHNLLLLAATQSDTPPVESGQRNVVITMLLWLSLLLFPSLGSDMDPNGITTQILCRSEGTQPATAVCKQKLHMQYGVTKRL